MIPIATIERLAKSYGAKRLQKKATVKIIAATEEYIHSLTTKAQKLAEHAGRQTIKEGDIELALTN